MGQVWIMCVRVGSRPDHPRSPRVPPCLLADRPCRGVTDRPAWSGSEAWGPGTRPLAAAVASSRRVALLGPLPLTALADAERGWSGLATRDRSQLLRSGSLPTARGGIRPLGGYCFTYAGYARWPAAIPPGPSWLPACPPTSSAGWCARGVCFTNVPNGLGCARRTH